MHHVGTDQQQLHGFLVAVDAAGGRQGQRGAAVQNGQPADAQQGLFGERQMQSIHHVELVEVDVRLIETIEQGDAVRARELKLFHEMRQRGKERRQLHGDGNADRPAQFGEQTEITRLHRLAGFRHLRRDMVDVEFQRIGAGLLQFTAQFHPAGRGDAVEARHHGNFQAAFELMQMRQVVIEAAAELAMIGQKAVLRFATAKAGMQQKAVHHRVFRLQLLFEQRIHHQCGGAGILQPQRRVEVARQRRCRGHQRVLELEAEVVGGKIDHVRFPVWIDRQVFAPVPDRP